MVVGVFLGPTLGLVDVNISLVLGNWLALPGQIFLAVIQMIVIPLVFASIIMGLASSENVAQLKSLGLLVTLYFVITTAIASAIGIVSALISKPGMSLAKTLHI